MRSFLQCFIIYNTFILMRSIMMNSHSRKYLAQKKESRREAFFLVSCQTILPVNDVTTCPNGSFCTRL
jgi:hypothetical protein